MKNTINDFLSKQYELKQKIATELAKLPKGKLYIKKMRNEFVPYIKINGKEKSIRKNNELSKELARKCFLQYKQATVEMYIRQLEVFLHSLDNDMDITTSKTYKRLKETFGFFDYAISKEENRFLTDSAPKESFRPESLKYITDSGIKVRSKSERIIANLLTSYGLIYIYEAELYIDGEIMRPDFLILTMSGDIVIWEHFGLTDNYDYYSKALNKIAKYRNGGYYSHTNLICTFEEDIISEELLKGVIKRFLL